MKYSHIVWISIFLVFTGCRQELADKEMKLQWLKKNIFEINVKTEDYDVKEFEFLQTELKDVDIVSLGEQSHGDGTTFLAKTKLIKFLHEKMGFNVLVFESGLIDCFYGFESIMKGNNPHEAFHNSVFEVWSEASQVQSLINYIGFCFNTDNPIELAGFDIQFTGQNSFDNRIKKLESLIQKENPGYNRKNYQAFYNVLLQGDKKKQKTSYTDEEKEKCFADLKKLNKLVSNIKNQSKELLLWKKTLENTEYLFKFYWNFTNEKGEINPNIANIRDKCMGQNLIWLKENLYQNKKVIVWGANSHLFYNRNLLKWKDKMIPMGDYVKKNYGERYYVIGFTSFTGEIGSRIKPLSKIGQVSNKTVEYLLDKIGVNSCFISFRDVKEESWIHKPFKAKFLGYKDSEGKWSKMMDGMVFIHTQRARTTMKKYQKEDR